MAKRTWQEFQDTDPYYSLLGEVQEHRVYNAETNTVEEERLIAYCERLFIQGHAKKPKDWVEVWAAMLIPVEIQAEVLEVILRFAHEQKPENLGEIMFELLKGMRVKVPAAQTAIKKVFAGAESTHGNLSVLLYRVYPKSPHSAWGWSRVGWGWQVWWQFLEQTLEVLQPTVAFDELALLLDRIEAGGDVPLSKQEVWKTQDRLSKAQKLLCKFGGLEEESDLLACLDATLA